MNDANSNVHSLQTVVEVSMAQVRQLNGWFIGWVAESRPEFNVLPPSQYRVLNSRSMARLSAFPILLTDFRFADTAFWSARRDEAAADDRDIPHEQATGNDRIAYAKSLLVAAWHISHAPRAPRFLFGMTEDVARIIDGLAFRQLDWIVTHHAMGLHPRWGDTQGFWCRLLRSAQDDDEQSWLAVQLQALRLTGRQLLANESDSEARH